MKTTSTCLTFLLLLTLNSCEEEEVVRTYVYINSTSLFSLPPSTWLPPVELGGIYVDDPSKPGYLTSLSFHSDTGETYTVKLSDVYNLYSSSGAGSSEPIEIPNREYTKMTISVSNTITGTRYDQGGTGDYTILGKATFNDEAELWQSGFWLVNSMENYAPFTSPSGKSYNGVVRRIELSSRTQLTSNDQQNENYYEYAADLDAYILNPPKRTSCLDGTWERSICGGSEKATVTFNNGTGSFTDEDCAGVCTNPGPGRIFTFTYTILSDSEMQITYTAGLICGQPNIPTGGNQPYSCDGNTLVFGNTYTRKN